MGILELFDRSVELFGDECERLVPLAEGRYGTSRFSGTGQYDWLSAQLLYLLYRHIRPESVVEFSSNTGYSTIVQAMALKANGHGTLRTVELQSDLALQAVRNLNEFDVGERVEMHVGDALAIVPLLVEEHHPSVLFVDSLHSRDFARRYLSDVVTRVAPDTLVHIHDIMPKTAEVRVHGWPPFDAGMTTIEVEVPPADRVRLSESGDLVFDGNYFGEAIMLTDMLDAVDPSDYVFVYDLRSRYPQLDPGRYDGVATARTDASCTPFEWNESLWTTAEVLLRASSQAQA